MGFFKGGTSGLLDLTSGNSSTKIDCFYVVKGSVSLFGGMMVVVSIMRLKDCFFLLITYCLVM